jgi:serine/threonine protein kinase
MPTDGAELWDYFDAGYFELLLGTQADREEARINHRAARAAADMASKHLRKLQTELADMKLIHHAEQKYSGETERARLIAPFRKGEIVCGALLGTGGFSSVYEVQCFAPDHHVSEESHPLEGSARDFLVHHAKRKCRDDTLASLEDVTTESYKLQRKRLGAYKGEGSYVVKHLKYSMVEDESKFEKAAVDLCLEGQLLLVTDHPNIISLRGWARQGTNAFKGGNPADYFLILDRLPEILDQQIYTWRKTLQKYKSRLALPWAKKKFTLKIKKLFGERVSVAHQVACGLEYLHGKRIINRDLKTSNIGFDLDGEVKIFDLGLSRLIPKDKYKLDDGYIMSRVGTKATMAPEVRQKLPYDISADVYSFGVVLWEILSLSTSTEYFRKQKREQRMQEADEEGDEDYLPLPCCDCWPAQIQDLIRRCLAYNPKTRPTMTQVRQTLADLMDELGIPVSKRQRRRSTFRLDLSSFDMDEFSSFCGDSSKEGLSLTDLSKMTDLTKSTTTTDAMETMVTVSSIAECGTVTSGALPVDNDEDYGIVCSTQHANELR